MLVLKKYVRLSFILLMAALFIVGCGNEENEPEEPVNDEPEVLNNENNENNVNEEIEENDEKVSGSGDQEHADAELDLIAPLEDIKEFYNSIYHSDADIIDQEDGLLGIRGSKSIETDTYQAIIDAYTFDPQARMTLEVNSGEDEYEEQANKNSLGGGSMAEEVEEGVYEYADSLIWTEDGNSYRLKGGRNVISTVEENNITPEEDRLLFYENLTETNQALDDVNEFVEKIITPTTLPSGYELDLVYIEKNAEEILALSYPLEFGYTVKTDDGGTLSFITYGEYEHAPQLVGEGVEETEVEGVTVQSKEDDIMFTLGDETYRINYVGLELDEVLEIAKSMIEQFK